MYREATDYLTFTIFKLPYYLTLHSLKPIKQDRRKENIWIPKEIKAK